MIAHPRKFHITFVSVLSIVALAVVPAGLAAKRGGGNNTPSAASCTVAGNTVTATGLPTDQVINFMISDSSGTSGWVLGYSDGTWTVGIPASSGPTTYQFVSRTSGPNGSKYSVFASC